MKALLRLLVSSVLLAGLLLADRSSAKGDQDEVAGRHIAVLASGAEHAVAEKVVARGDEAVERYAQSLGVSVPDTRFKVFLYETEAEYAAAEEKRTHGTFRTNLAFTYAKDAEVHMVCQPRPMPDGLTTGGPGMLEALAMHELSHALQYKLVPSYDEQPDWLSEGFAETCSERAIAGSDAPAGCADRVPWFAASLYEVRGALDDGSFIPIEHLLNEGLQGRTPHERQVRYGEAWALVRFLDSAADPKRREAFRSFMRDVMALPPHDDVAKRTNARFREVFGTPAAKGDGARSLAALERKLVDAVRAEKAYPWQIVYRDLRAAADGGVIAESFPESSALALSAAPPLSTRARVKAEVTVLDGAGQQVDLVFAYRGPEDYYKLAFGCGGYVTLMRFSGEWKNIANAKVNPELFRAGVPHEIEANIDVGRLTAKVDGKLVFRYSLPARCFGSGRCGVGAYDGRVAVRSFVGESN